MHGEGSTFFEDLQLLADAQVHPVVVAPEAPVAREIVRIVNRSTTPLRTPTITVTTTSTAITAETLGGTT